MKSKIKIIAPALLLALSLSACGGSDDQTSSSDNSGSGSETVSENLPNENGYYEEPVTLNIGQGVMSTLTFPDGDSYEDNVYTRYIKEQTNIDIVPEWQAQDGSDYEQKLNLSIASNDIPDALVVDEQSYRYLLESNMIQDLKPSYDAYASQNMRNIYATTNNEALDAVTTEDGKMYALPNTVPADDNYNLIWVRKDWLDELGLEPPETREDVRNIAQAFVDNDMSGTGATIGFGGPQNGGRLYNNFLSPSGNLYTFDSIFTTFGAYPGFWIEDENGEATYGSIMPETRDALEFLSDMYADGLIDPQIGMRKEGAEPIISGQTGMFGGVWWNGYSPFPETWANDPSADWQAYMLQDDNGEYYNHFGPISSSYVVVSKDYDHPEVAVILNDLLLECEDDFPDEIVSPSDVWPLRISLSPADENQTTIDAMQSVLSGETTPEDYNTEEYKPYKLLPGDVTAIEQTKLEPYDNLGIEYWDPSQNPSGFQRCYSLMVGAYPYSVAHRDEIHKVYSKTYSQTETMERKWDNLQKMEDETFLKIITGAEPIEAWDTYVADWKAQGGDEITAEVNAIE